MSVATSIKKEASVASKRLIHHIKGAEQGPKIIFFGGIHGNEPAGVIALERTLNKIEPANIKGEIFGIYGNLKALKSNVRYLETDLNRIWITEQVNQLKSKTFLSPEEEEQKEIYQIISRILQNNEAPIYFIDFHTTSSASLPFITINDALINRAFSKAFPVPIVLGIEEYLEGPLLSFLNKEGYVSLGFEAGQHTDECSIKNCEAFIYLTLVTAGSVPMELFKEFPLHYKTLRNQARGLREIFEVMHKHHIKSEEEFIMNPGFASFQKITKGEELALSNDDIVTSPMSARLFMPLYQKQGEDGFFIIRPIPNFFLRLSARLRQVKADQVLTLLPGISWQDKENGVLKANLRVARFLTKSIFHLLGYRSKKQDQKHIILYNRERVARNYLYKECSWYKV